jgi:hypothetical protein
VVGDISSPVGENDFNVFSLNRLGIEDIMNLPRLPHGYHRGMLQEKENIAGLFLHPRLGQLILQLESRFIVDHSQAEGTAGRLFLVRLLHILKIASKRTGVNKGQKRISMANDQ